MCVVPDERGGYTERFEGVFSCRRSHASEGAAASLKCAMELLAANREIGPATDGLVLYVDGGNHFASGEFVCGVLWLAFRNSRPASYKFHASFRGKTEMGAHSA